MYGWGRTPFMIMDVSNVLPSLSWMFQFWIFFSIATVMVPPCLVGPLLHSFGFVSQVAKPGDVWAWLSPPSPLVAQALTTSTDAAAIATKPPSPLDRVRIFPPVKLPPPAAEVPGPGHMDHGRPVAL